MGMNFEGWAGPVIRDLIQQRDKKWFENHPGRTEYTRFYIPGEVPDEVLVPGKPLPVMTVVTQVAPGIRTRRFLDNYDPSKGGPSGYVALDPDTIDPASEQK